MNIINTFLFYSIMGHFLENCVYTKVDSGILYGYWTPIYGLGVLLILGIFYIIKKKVSNKFYRPLLLFLISSITLGIIEFCGGLIIEKVFGRIFWDYSYQTFNIGRYTSLRMMLIWGLASLLLVYLINPFLNFIIKKIPKIITITLAFLFLYDLVFTLITLN